MRACGFFGCSLRRKMSALDHFKGTVMNSTSARTALVLGANGRFGQVAVRAFAAAGWQVRAHTRRAPATPWPAGVQSVRCDALDLATLTAAAQGAEVIVQALNPDYTRWDTLLPPITQATLALAGASGARLMVPGNVYNFGRELPAQLDEATPFVANTPKAAQRIAMEASMQEAAHTRGVKSVVIRAGDFLGGTGTWLDLAMARRLPRGVFTQMGQPDIAHAWAWLPDLAQTFVRVAEVQAALPAFETLHHTGLTLTGAQLQAAVEAALGQPLRNAQFPWWLMQLASPVAAMPRALLQMRYLWQRPHQLVSHKLPALIGPEPSTPVDVVMRQALQGLPATLLPPQALTPRPLPLMVAREPRHPLPHQRERAG
jgi:nucleoside-diphosphate-sugar epimerase